MQLWPNAVWIPSNCRLNWLQLSTNYHIWMSSNINWTKLIVSRFRISFTVAIWCCWWFAGWETKGPLQQCHGPNRTGPDSFDSLWVTFIEFFWPTDAIRECNKHRINAISDSIETGFIRNRNRKRRIFTHRSSFQNKCNRNGSYVRMWLYGGKQSRIEHAFGNVGESVATDRNAHEKKNNNKKKNRKNNLTQNQSNDENGKGSVRRASQ